MFKRFKNWIFGNPAEDHAVASFAWFGVSYLALGTTAAFPALAPVAVGTAVLASKIGLFEGIVTGAHVVKNALSWGFKKLFGSKTASTKSEPVKSNPKSENAKEQEHQPERTPEKSKTQERPQPQKTAEPENPRPVRIPSHPHGYLR